MTDPKKRRLAIIGTVLAGCCLLFFLAIPLMSGFLGRFVPHSVQDKVGKKVIEATRDEAQWCTAPKGLAALDSLVDKLAAQADHDAPFRVYVVDDDVLNAFAAPGGHLVIYREIIDRARDPQELAGVLAHEIAHETLLSTHPTGEHRQTQIANLHRAGAPALGANEWQALRSVCSVKSTTAAPVGT